MAHPALVDALIELGARPEDIAGRTDAELQELASFLALRPGHERLTRAEVAQRAGVDEAFVRRLWLLLGLPDRGPEARTGSERDVALLDSDPLASDAAGLRGMRVALTAVAGRVVHSDLDA